jgi:hypothetical protein
MFRSRGYVLWVAAELVALVVGNVILGATGHGAYVAAFVGAAVVGVAFGVADGTRQAVEASTGLIAAASLFVAGGWGLAYAAFMRDG